MDDSEDVRPSAETPREITSRHAAPAAVAARATWSLRDVAIGFLWAIGIVLLIEIAVTAPLLAFFDEESPELFFGASVSSSIRNVLLVVLVYHLVRRRGASWPQLGLPELSRGAAAVRELAGAIGSYWPTILGAFLLAEVAVIGYGVVVDAAGADDFLPQRQFPDEWFDHPYIVPVFAFGVAVLTPLGEEVLFRGYIFGGLRRRLGVLTAALVSGLVFAVAHIDPGFYVPFTIVGVILALLYERTGKLAVPIGVHFLFNFTAVLLLALFPEARG